LPHPAVVGGHDHEGEIGRPDASNHVLHEVLVTRDVDDSHVDDPVARFRKVERREAEVDRDAPSLLLGDVPAGFFIVARPAVAPLALS
jgi:hypothetical protein